MKIKEQFRAPTPKEAYALAVDRYGKGITIIKAEHIKSSDGKLHAQLTILVDEEKFKHAHKFDTPDTTDTHVSNKVVRRFIQKGIDIDWLDATLSSVKNKNVFCDEELLASYVFEQIDAQLTIRSEPVKFPLIRLMIGPTGVGKTTTLAKIAARYTHNKHNPPRVMLINLDNYKVGANAQLEAYAKMMSLAYRNVKDTDHFSDVLKEARQYDVVLIDTAGMSPYDTKKFIEVVKYLEYLPENAVFTDLVLPATIKYEDMHDIYQNFSFLNPSGLIVTKLDETRHYGSIINFALRYDIALTYFSIGQSVPQDLLIADKEYLLSRFIGEFSN